MNNPNITDNLLQLIKVINKELFKGLRRIVPDVKNTYQVKDAWNRIANFCYSLLNKNKDAGNVYNKIFYRKKKKKVKKK